MYILGEYASLKLNVYYTTCKHISSRVSDTATHYHYTLPHNPHLYHYPTSIHILIPTYCFIHTYTPHIYTHKHSHTHTHTHTYTHTYTLIHTHTHTYIHTHTHILIYYNSKSLFCCCSQKILINKARLISMKY